MIDQMAEMMSKGKTQKEVCAAIGITEETFLQWKNPDSPHYEEPLHRAYKIAKLHQYAWWVSKGRRSIRAKKDDRYEKFDTALYALFMANMFGWHGGGKKRDELEERAKRIEKMLGIEDE